jgi:hypothetical protein
MTAPADGMTPEQLADEERQFRAITEAIGNMLWDEKVPIKARAVMRNAIIQATRLHAFGAGLPPEDFGEDDGDES